MNLTIFVSLLFGLQAIYWFVGKRAAKNIDSREEYFLAGKRVGFFPLMMTFLATQVGGGLVLGAAEEAYHYGWPVLLYPLGASLGMIFLGLGLGRRLARFPVSTVAQIFEVVYRSTVLKKIASLLSVISLFMVLVGMIIASSKFLVSIGFDNTPLFIAFWGIVILYTVQGGLKAVISTDIAQASFFSLVFFLCFGLVATSSSASGLQLPSMQQFASVSSKLTGWLLMPMLFMVIEQDMAQRCFAGKSPRIVSQATLWSGIFTMAICTVPVFFGVLAKTMGLDVPQGASVLMTAVAQTTNPTITAIVGCAVLAAIISTATSLINAIGSNLASDFMKKFESVRLVRSITAAISVAAIFFAFRFDNVVDMLIQSYELSVSCLFVPIFAALWIKRGSLPAAVLSVLFGSIGFCLFRFVDVQIPRELVSIFLSLVGYGCGLIMTRKQEEIAA